MGGKDVIYVKQLHSSALQPADVQKRLKAIADKRFLDANGQCSLDSKQIYHNNKVCYYWSLISFLKFQLNHGICGFIWQGWFLSLKKNLYVASLVVDLILALCYILLSEFSHIKLLCVACWRIPPAALRKEEESRRAFVDILYHMYCIDAKVACWRKPPSCHSKKKKRDIREGEHKMKTSFIICI